MSWMGMFRLCLTGYLPHTQHQQPHHLENNVGGPQPSRKLVNDPEEALSDCKTGVGLLHQ